MKTRTKEKTPRSVLYLRVGFILVLIGILGILLNPTYQNLRYGPREDRILASISPELRQEALKILEEIPKSMYNDFKPEDLERFLNGTTPFKPPEGFWAYVLSNSPPSGNNMVASYGWNYHGAFELASSIAQGKNERETAYALMEWVLRNIEYGNVEASYNMKKMLSSRQGVCDQKATMYVALARSVGIPARKVIATAATFGQLGHSWVEVYIEGKWIMVDPTNSWFDQPYVFKKVGWNFSNVVAAAPIESGGESYIIDRTSYYFP
ncbi:MAG: transglutaminase family protein [Candidatus Methanofastidiosia archaeon]